MPYWAASQCNEIIITVLNNAIEGAWNAIDTSANTFAKLTKTVGAADAVRLSVLNPIGQYPVGTFAGFRVVNENTGLLQLDLFNSITVTTYLDGDAQQTISGSNLINLGLLGLPVLGSGNGTPYNLGFYTSMPFDEIQISLNNLVGANVNLTNTLRVYGAFVDTRFATGGGIVCFSTKGDFGVTHRNQEIAGDVSTNDVMPASTTYGTLVANAGNPTADLPSINNDGSYTFMPTVAGVYIFSIPVCPSGPTGDCTSEQLKITVLDPDVNTNPPVVNNDIAYVRGTEVSPATPVAINVSL